MADQDLEPSDSQDISEIRRKALALLERCGTTDSDDDIDYNDDSDNHNSDSEEEEETEMRNIRSSEFQKRSSTPRNGKAVDGSDEEVDVEEQATATDDDEESYGDAELDPLVKAVRELSYSLETDMVERQESTVSRLTDDGGIHVNRSICCCCNCCCCKRWSRRTQCLAVWIIVILLLLVSYFLFLTQYPGWKRKHDGI